MNEAEDDMDPQDGEDSDVDVELDEDLVDRFMEALAPFKIWQMLQVDCW